MGQGAFLRPEIEAIISEGRKFGGFRDGPTLCLSPCSRWREQGDLQMIRGEFRPDRGRAINLKRFFEVYLETGIADSVPLKIS